MKIEWWELDYSKTKYNTKYGKLICIKNKRTGFYSPIIECCPSRQDLAIKKLIKIDTIETNPDYFGKNCKYFNGVFETGEDSTPTTYQDNGTIPSLVFCNHENNICDTEGNCNKLDCPLNSDINQNTAEIETNTPLYGGAAGGGKPAKVIMDAYIQVRSWYFSQFIEYADEVVEC